MSKKQDTEPFCKAARKEFNFLVEVYGFKEVKTPEDKNQFSIWYSNDTTKIVIESISYGLYARVAFGRSSTDGRFENYDINDLVSICCPEKTVTDEKMKQGPFKMLPVFAELLRICGEPILKGNFSIFPKLQDIVDGRIAEFNKKS